MTKLPEVLWRRLVDSGNYVSQYLSVRYRVKVREVFFGRDNDEDYLRNR